MEHAIAPQAASEPPVVFRDGFGERRRIAGATEADNVDVLYLKRELTEVPAFEFALRERASRLSQFRHPLFGRVRNVERLADQSATMVVVSDAVDGVRLSDLLATSLPLEIPAVLHLLKQLVPAVATLHKFAPEAAHGAIGPERIILTSDARVILVEHVLGTAVERLRLTHEQYWRDLRVAFPRPAVVLKCDPRTDVTQIGIVALSLILGRLLHPDEYPNAIGDIVTSAWDVSTQSGGAVPADLRTWLARTVQLDARSGFTSAIEAEAEFDRMLGDIDYSGAATALADFIAEYYQLNGRPVPSAPPLPTTVPKPSPKQPGTAAAAPAPTLQAERAKGPAGERSGISTMKISPLDMKPPAAKSSPREGASGAQAAVSGSSAQQAAPVSGAHQVSPSSAPQASSGSHPLPRVESTMSKQVWSAGWFRGAAAAAVLVVVIGGGVLAGRHFFAPPTDTPSTGKLVMDTSPAGAQIVVDGEAAGTTPVTLTLKAGLHTIELKNGGATRSIPVTVVAGTEIAQYVELPKNVPSPGQLQIRTEPAGAKVTVDGILRGSSPVTIGDLTPGTHAVTLESDAGSAKQTVTIEPGTTASLVVQLTPQGVPLSGWIAVSAPAAVQIFENGRLIGSSQSEQVMVAAGPHQLSIVNDALGYRAARNVTVAAGKVSAIKLDFPRGTISLNASPWAEVWIDGDKLGETPIGNAPVVIGSHEVVFRHPDLGEQRHVVTVTATAPAKLSVDMRKK